MLIVDYDYDLWSFIIRLKFVVIGVDYPNFIANFFLLIRGRNSVSSVHFQIIVPFLKGLV